MLKWVKERDTNLDEDLKHGRRQGVKVNTEDGSVTYTLGKLRIEGKRSTLDKQQMLLEMSKITMFASSTFYIVEDDLNVREPVNLLRYLFLTWGAIGIYVFYKDFKSYYRRMS